jgi:hypothetical protein
MVFFRSFVGKYPLLILFVGKRCRSYFVSYLIYDYDNGNGGRSSMQGSLARVVCEGLC